VAKHARFFEKNDLDVELLFVQPAVLAQAMLAGDPPIGISGPVEIEANLRGADFVILGTLTTAGLAFLITRTEISQVGQLRGKRFGISRLGAAPHRILEMALEKLAIDPKDVTILQAGGTSERLAAVRAGNLDATIVSVEAAYAAKRAGLNVIVDLKKLGVEYLLASMVTTRRFTRENENTARRFVKSMVEAIHYFKTHKQESIDIIARVFKTGDRESLEFAYNWAIDAIDRKPYPSIAGLKALLESIGTRDQRAKAVTPQDFVDSRFVKELDDSGYIDRLYTSK
jgi:NitT/TauT family transport system substrate-binding protein